MLRVVVVDDRADVLAGRLEWLHSAGCEARGLDFEAALDYSEWTDCDVAVLDGRDDRPKAAVFGEDSLPDRFLGPRVARHIRDSGSKEQPVIILISAYARTHPELSLRCRDAGVDYIFDYFDTATRDAFVAAVADPARVDAPLLDDWRRHGYLSRPRAESAVITAQASPAWRHLLGMSSDAGTGHERRKLREDLGRLLPTSLYSSSTRRRVAHNSELRPVLRKLLGLRPEDDSEAE